jgi:acyl-ACP thioesterase
MKAELSQTFFLSAGETNAEGELSLPLLVSKIIDIATAHANALGVGNPAMASLHCGWVLSRVAIEMESYPKVNSNYTLTTWMERFNRHFSERIIMISDTDGKIYGYARTIWMVLNTETHESMDLSHLNLNTDMVSDRPCPIERQGKHHLVLPKDYEGEMPRGALRATAPDWEYTFRYCDLDFYRHVNTVRYVSLLLNRFDLERMDANRVKRLEISFMREGKYGTSVRLSRSESEDGKDVAFAISDKDTNAEIMFARVLLTTLTPSC